MHAKGLIQEWKQIYRMMGITLALLEIQLNETYLCPHGLSSGASAEP